MTGLFFCKEDTLAFLVEDGEGVTLAVADFPPEPPISFLNRFASILLALLFLRFEYELINSYLD